MKRLCELLEIDVFKICPKLDLENNYLDELKKRFFNFQQAC